MAMQKITMDQTKKLAEQYGLKPCKVKGGSVVNIRKKINPNLEDISWEKFESILKDKGLAVFKADKSDFIKIMKDK